MLLLVIVIASWHNRPNLTPSRLPLEEKQNLLSLQAALLFCL